MVEALILWSHALGALMFAGLALWAARSEADGLPRWPLVAALGATAAWALAVAGLGGADAATRFAEGVRNLALLGVMYALARQARGRVPALSVYGVVMLVILIGATLQLAAATLAGQPEGTDLAKAAIVFRMIASVAALVLVQNLHARFEASEVRWLAGGLAILWAVDLNLAVIAYWSGDWPHPLTMARGFALAVAAGAIAVAIQRERRGPVQVSRTIAYQSLSLVAVGGYFALLAIVTSALATVGGASARIWQTAFVIGSTAAALTLASSPWLRAWTKVKVAKHLFRHRYDYRAEWLRFTGTLGTPGGAAPLSERVIKAVADLTDSPAGLLLVPDGVALGVGTGWNWPAERLPRSGGDAGFAEHLVGEHIIELDALRRSGGHDAALAPQWLLDEGDAWAVVPLTHLGALAGAIVLTRPPIDRALDWEDFDLLKVAGRQAASYLAEAQAQDALADGRRFDEFNRRFAFIVHDIKNLVSGLSLVARNAERHADNPAFRADMVATLQDSAAKLNGLLARLSANARAGGDTPAPVALLPIVERVAAARRAGHPVVVAGAPGAHAVADPVRLEALLGHLVQNAIDASAPHEPVTLAIDGATIAVLDRGCGMAPSFVRDQLFRPFVSSKPAGFGIGAFEARQLAEAMGGSVEVDSREGEGTTFRVILQPATAPQWDVAA